MSNVIRLGDYITEISEKTTVNNQHMVLTSSQEGIVSQDDYFNKQVASKDNTGYKIIRRGQFTYRAMSDTGRFYINRLTDYDIGIVSPAYPVFELRTNGQILPEYLQEYFHSEHFQNAITLSSTGSTRVSLKLAKIADLRIDIPTLPKQQCAVQAISHVNHLISMQNSSAAKLDQLVKSRFVEMFGEPIANTHSLPLISLSEVGSWNSGGTPSRSNPAYFEGDIDWYSAGELNTLYLEGSVEKVTQDALENSTAKLFPAGSMLVGMYDTAAFKMGILKWSSASNQACACIEPNNSIDIVWLYHVLQIMKPHFLEQRRGIRQKNLNLGMIKSFQIPYASKPEQNRFASFVSEVDKSKLSYEMEVAA